MKAEAVLKYICPVCHDFHDDEFAAIDCCEPDIETTWVCSECDEHDHIKSRLEAHIKAEHPEDLNSLGLPFVSRAELEQYGQVKLFNY